MSLKNQVELPMWVMFSSFHSERIERVPCSVGGPEATCMDVSLVPNPDQRLDFSCGCYGCPDVTDIDYGDAVSGFSTSFALPIQDHLECLSQDASLTPRSKKAFSVLKRLAVLFPPNVLVAGKIRIREADLQEAIGNAQQRFKKNMIFLFEQMVTEQLLRAEGREVLTDNRAMGDQEVVGAHLGALAEKVTVSDEECKVSARRTARGLQGSVSIKSKRRLVHMCWGRRGRWS